MKLARVDEKAECRHESEMRLERRLTRGPNYTSVQLLHLARLHRRLLHPAEISLALCLAAINLPCALCFTLVLEIPHRRTVSWATCHDWGKLERLCTEPYGRQQWRAEKLLHRFSLTDVMPRAEVNCQYAMNLRLKYSPSIERQHGICSR